MEMDTPQTFPPLLLLPGPFSPFSLQVFRSRQILGRLMQDDVRHAIKDLGCKMKNLGYALAVKMV